MSWQRSAYPIETPPLTWIFCPVIKAASLLARTLTALAISVGVPRR